MQDFEIDELSQEYLQYRPQQSRRDPSSLIEEHFEPAMDDEDDEPGSSDASEADEVETKRSKPVRCVHCDISLIFSFYFVDYIFTSMFSQFV